MPFRLAVRLRHDSRFWSRPPSPARLLCLLVRQILKFHESEPLLAAAPEPGPIPVPPMMDPMPQPPLPPNPPAPATAPASAPAPSGSLDPEKIENRSGFGQFRSDFAPPDQNAAASHPPPTPTPTPSPQRPWSLRPDESPADYQLFTAWLHLPAPRRLRQAAPTLGTSLYRLRRLAARYYWKNRAAAFDEERAQTTSRALDQLLYDETSSWKERCQTFRNQEWLLHKEMLQIASDAVAQLRKHPGRVSLRDMVQLYELGFRLGCHACGLPFDTVPVPVPPAPKPPAGYLDFQARLEKVYGSTPAQPATENSKSSPGQELP